MEEEVALPDVAELLKGRQVVEVRDEDAFLVLVLDTRFEIHFPYDRGVVIVHPDPQQVN